MRQGKWLLADGSRLVVTRHKSGQWAACVADADGVRDATRGDYLTVSEWINAVRDRCGLDERYN